MSRPLVSVIVATYNHVAYVEQSLTSALAQDYPDVEVIVADDASTDGTSDKILQLAGQWGARLVPVIGGQNVGPAANCNRGLSRRRGKYVCFLAGDDLYLPGKLTRQVEWMEADASRVVCGHAVEAFDDETGAVLFRTTDIRPLRSGRGATEMLQTGGLFSGLSLMVRSAVIPPYGYDERVGLLSDWKLQVDCLVDGGSYGYVEGVFTRYRVHKAGLHQRSQREEAVHLQFLEGYLTTLSLVEAAHPELLKSCARGRGLFLFSEARHHIARGRKQSARAYYRAAVRQRPALLWKAAAGILLSTLPQPIQRRLEWWLTTRRAAACSPRSP